MTYIYDIALNFQENYYQFFEWNRQDRIKNIQKLPLYHVSDQDIFNLKDNQVTIKGEFLELLKSENQNKKRLQCLVSNTQITLGLLFNESGFLLKRSSLIYEEEEETNTTAFNLPLTEITYQENKPIVHENKLRIEKEKKELLINYIIDLNNKLLLKYLYYEYFNEEGKNLSQMKETLLRELENNWTKKQNDLYHLVILLSKNNLSLKERTNSG